jgi:hypothetical protein
MTLAEVMVAMVLFGILAAFIVGVVNSVLNLWQAGERRGRGDLVFAATIERLRGDVTSMHTGPRGWLELDSWQAAPEVDGHPAWRLPRLRFLADGAIAREADPTGRGAVEVAWLLVPENAGASRLCRLVRLVQPESAPRSLREENWITQLARSGAGLTVMDGVLHADFLVRELPADDLRASISIDSYALFGFPREIEFRVERVSGGSRRKPAVLDSDIDEEMQAFLARGSPPFALPEYVLIDQEWMRVSGTWPRLQAPERGARNSLPRPHGRGSIIWVPEPDQATAPLPAAGGRLP